MEFDNYFIFYMIPYIGILTNLLVLINMLQLKKDFQEVHSDFLALQDEVLRNFHQNCCTNCPPDEDDPE